MFNLELRLVIIMYLQNNQLEKGEAMNFWIPEFDWGAIGGGESLDHWIDQFSSSECEITGVPALYALEKEISFDNIFSGGAHPNHEG